MAYTSEEIQAAVQKLVQSRIRVPVDTSGVRNNAVEFDDMQTAAAGVFINHPEAPYYVIALGADRLLGETNQLVQSIENLQEKILATGRRTFPIDNLTSLADAENALVELESALGSRSSGISDPTKIPSYLRFSNSSLDYIEHIGRNVKENGQIVDTPNQARLEIPSIFNAIIDSYKAILTKERYLQGAIEDYKALQLPAKVAQGVIQNARDMLSEDRSDLEARSEDKRLEVARDKTLNALTAKSIVDSYVAGQQVADEISASGKLVPYSDANRLAYPASVDGDLPGPWPFISYPVPRGYPPDVRDNNRFTLTLESKQYEIILPTSYMAFLQGNGKTNPPDDPAGVFTFYKKGIEGIAYAENFDGNEDKPDLWYFPDPNSVFVIQQFIEGGATTTYTMDLISDPPDVAKHFVPDSGTPWYAYKVELTMSEVVSRLNAYLVGAGCYIRAKESDNHCLAIECVDPIECLVDRVVGIRCVNSPDNTAAQNPLGFFKGLEMSSKRTPANSLVTTMTGLTSKANPGLVAYPLDNSLAHMMVWTNVANKAGVVLAKWTGYADVVLDGADIVLTLGPNLDPFTNFNIQIGDVVCFPRQYVKDGVDFVPMPDEGALYAVSTVASHSVRAVYVSGPTAEVYPSRNLDIGSSAVLNTIEKYQVVQIFTKPNDGGFEITSVDEFSKFRAYFDLMLSQNSMPRDPLPLAIEVTLGPASISLASADETTASYIKVEGTARPLIFSTVPSSRGDTLYVQLPEKFPKLLAGDKLEFWESSSVAYLRTIKLVEERILTLDDTVPSEISFDINVSTYPHVTILSGNKKAYDATKVELEVWEEEEPTDIDSYAANVNALLNPLLVNRVPPVAQVQAANAEVGKLKDKAQILADSLANVDATRSRAVDDLLATLKAKGCDRGIDLLLQGRFSEFFGLDMDDMTYAGAMMKAVRDVARNDLATSKFGTQRMQRKVLSMTADTDPDYDHSDSDAVGTPPDIVAGADMPSWS